MTENTKELTSLFARAYHTENSKNPIVYDTLARRLLSDTEYEEIADYLVNDEQFNACNCNTDDSGETLYNIVNTYFVPSTLAGASYCESRLDTAVLSGCTQYVILGAGYDTFAWRCPYLMKRLRVFAVDKSEILSDMEKRVVEAGESIPDNLCFVPSALDTDDLLESLLSSGFDQTKKTFFSLYGAEIHMTDDETEKLISHISTFASEGSTLFFDGIEKKDIEPMLERNGFLVYEKLLPNDVVNLHFSNDIENKVFTVAVCKGTQLVNTKEKIMLTALKLFSDNGYEAVSIRDIAEKLHITKGALYRHYGSKRDVFDSIIKRMEELDAKYAVKFNLPPDSYDKNPSEYRATTIKDICLYTESQFRYWTVEDFPSRFRRMLTIEQFGSEEMRGLYEQYLSSGPLEYVAELMSNISDDPMRLALEFFAPIYLMYSIFDSSANKKTVIDIVHRHIQNFLNKYGDEKNELQAK